MIVEGVCSFACRLLYSLFSALEFVTLPVDLISTLAHILQYGTWVVGADVLLLFTGSVALWWGVKASIGVALWLYDKLPLT